MGFAHAKNLFEGKVEGGVLAAVCDIDHAKLQKSKESFDCVPCFNDALQMYKSNLIDACVIAVPHFGHPPLAELAFANGIHVMCEKPSGVYTKAVREMNETAKKTGLVFAVMFNQRTDPMYIKMREIVKSGELGEIKRTNWIITDWYRCQYYYNSGGWRATWEGEGGGVLLNQCPHNLDLWQWICGMPKRVHAFCHEGKWHDVEIEDDVTAYAEYENGATGVFVTCTADAPGTNRFEITGDCGKLVCENRRLTFYKLETPERVINATSTEAFVSPKYTETEIDISGENPQHIGVLKAFAGRILYNKPLIAEGYEGINSLLISNAMYLSGWLGKTVEIPFDEDLFLAELNKKLKTKRV
jgi:predicted dehydrogenase